MTESKGGFGFGGGYGGYGASRFDSMNTFGSNYTTPGWQRAQRNRRRGEDGDGFSDEGSEYDAQSRARGLRGDLSRKAREAAPAKPPSPSKAISSPNPPARRRASASATGYSI